MAITRSSPIMNGMSFGGTASESWPNLLNLLDDANPRSELESDYQGLLSNKRFEGLLVARRYNLNESLGRLDGLVKDTQELVNLLEVRLALLKPT